MGLVAEELVEELLRRNGYFTVRGARCGHAEADLFAVRRTGTKTHLVHVEIQASTRAATAFDATQAQKLRRKFTNREIKDRRKRLWPGEWTFWYVKGDVRDRKGWTEWRERLARHKRCPIQGSDLSEILEILRTDCRKHVRCHGDDLASLVVYCREDLDE